MLPEESDTEAVFRSLQNSEDLCDTLKRIKGPWAFIYYRVCLYPFLKS